MGKLISERTSFLFTYNACAPARTIRNDNAKRPPDRNHNSGELRLLDNGRELRGQAGVNEGGDVEAAEAVDEAEVEAAELEAGEVEVAEDAEAAELGE
ncbi:hypothetical protein O1611_g2664 [Lasiodiplodia mahajangana]|uniref:Uncharacterized protein n=1 Tax=Lasiodiplodia mahajangana TaxID=1108764 RepID=A0ACC2JUM8_9PEZI|nr:hypothetical protein O1611_g2664 [Lasiodiplodia mahajangana]